jgi:hypothetical protein
MRVNLPYTQPNRVCFYSPAIRVSWCFRAPVKLCCTAVSGWQISTLEDKLNDRMPGRTGVQDE